MYERLAAGLSADGYSCFRFDRRGVGDSAGEDPGFRASGPDIEAAAAAFRREVPRLGQVFGIGLCDGATALSLFGAECDLQGLVLLNPWLVEAEADKPAPAAVRAHYRDRLLSLEGWKRLLGGGVSLRKLVGGLRTAADSAPSTLAGEVAAALRGGAIPAEVILAAGDGTAAAAAHELKSRTFKGLTTGVQTLSSDSHTFARAGDGEALLAACLASVRRLEGLVRR
jgi:hypothetical protein